MAEVKIKESKKELEEIKKAEKLALEAENIKKSSGEKKVFLISTINDDNEEVSAWFRRPTLKEFSDFTSISQKDSIAGIRSLMDDVFISGNKDIIDDDYCFLASMSQIEGIIHIQASTIKKF